MKYFIFLILTFVLINSCVTDYNPVSNEDLGYNILIIPTGKTGNGFLEFRFSNTTNKTLWYWGYSKNSPLYNIQIQSDTGWVHSGGWCGTGLNQQYFKPFETIKVNVFKQSESKAWRVGIYTSVDTLKIGEYSWSAVQD